MPTLKSISNEFYKLKNQKGKNDFKKVLEIFEKRGKIIQYH